MKLLYLIKKEILLEYKNKQFIYYMLSLSFSLSFFLSIAIYSAFLEQAIILKLFPILVWLIFIFSASLSYSHSYIHETKEKAVWRLQLQNIPANLIFITKSFSTFIFTVFIYLVTFFLLAILLNINIFSFYLLSSSLIVISAFSLLANLLAVFSATSKINNLITSLLLLVLSTPLIIAACEVSFEIIFSKFNFLSPWFILIICLNLLYLLFGLLFYSKAIESR